MRSGWALATVWLLSGCVGAPSRPSAELLAGCYSHVDDLGYNVMRVQLKPDGTYLAELQGDIGLWASAEGQWRVVGARVALMPGTEVHGTPLPESFEIERTPFSVALRIPHTWNQGYTFAPLHTETCNGAWMLPYLGRDYWTK